MDRSPRLLLEWGHGGNIWFLLRLTYRVKEKRVFVSSVEAGESRWKHVQTV
jgi:hypothetical protein